MQIDLVDEQACLEPKTFRNKFNAGAAGWLQPSSISRPIVMDLPEVLELGWSRRTAVRLAWPLHPWSGCMLCRRLRTRGAGTQNIN